MAEKVNFSPRGDWSLETTPDGARVVIPTRPVWVVMIFLLVWLGGWVAGETSAISSLRGDSPLFVKAFLLFWLAGWTAGGIAAITAFLFTSGLAREVLSRDGPDFCLRWEAFGVGWTRRFPVSSMGPLAAPPAPLTEPSATGGTLKVEGGSAPLRPSGLARLSGALWKAGDRTAGLKFSFGGKEVSIGTGLDAGQAERLADVLASRFGLRRAD